MAASINQDTAIYAHQSSQFDLFKGLSDHCSTGVERHISKILELMEVPFVKAIRVKGLDNNIGAGRVIKHAAKRAMEAKYFDILIWAIDFKKHSSQRQFQLEIAKKLGIGFPIKEDSGDSEQCEASVKRDISKFLNNKRFLLVHNGPWQIKDLWAIGFSDIGYTQSMVLVLSSDEIPYHENVTIDAKGDEVIEIFQEECVDISQTLSLKGVTITCEAVMDCILYFLLFADYYGEEMEVEVQNLQRHWFAEGLIGDAVMDLEATFKSGMALIEELDYRRMISFKEKSCFISSDGSTLWSSLSVWAQSGSSSCPHRYSINENLNLPTSDKLEKISIVPYVEPPPISPKFPKLSTIICNKFSFSDLPTVNFFDYMENLQVFSVQNSELAFLPSSIARLSNLKLLSLQYLPRCLQIPFLKPLHQLLVLDLSGTPIQGLPDDSFECMQNLRLLDLSKCHRMSSLPSSLSSLVNLEILLLGGCTELRVLPSSTLPLKKLQTINLSKTNLTEIPDKFFTYMTNLRKLKLSFVEHLINLPSSMSSLVSLKILNLESCTSLKTVVSCLRHFSSSIEVLNLSECTSLEDITQFLSFPLCSLRVLNLSYVPVKFLILNSWTSLETLTLRSNKQLEVLNLSGTKIKTFPFEKCFEDRMSCCRLDLLFTRDNWLSQKQSWDQCGDDGVLSHVHIPLDEWRKAGNGVGAFISAENAYIFESLTASSVLWGSLFSRFLVNVGNCIKRVEGRALMPQKKGTCYKDIYSHLRPHVPLYDRCLTVGRGKKISTAISAIVRRTNFLYVHDESTIVKLSELGNMDDLRECWLERCQTMEVVFSMAKDSLGEHQPILRCLEKLRISKLMKLLHVCLNEGFPSDISFGRLKHLQLEYCPKVVSVLTSAMCLENLEVLEIKFCARLEVVFGGKVHIKGSLRKLHKVVLWELPNLKSVIHNIELLALKSIQVRGCRQLRKLPIINNASVTVTGESKWWEQLEWANNKKKLQIVFNSRKPYTALKREIFSKCPRWKQYS